jgi:hypothetical protein
MSLAIEVDDITHVLLADGWHTVHDASFGIDSYEFMWREGRATTRCLEAVKRSTSRQQDIAAAHRGSTSRQQDSASLRVTTSSAAR